MLIEGLCHKGSCPIWIINDLGTSLTPICPTCKGDDTHIMTDESLDEPDEYVSNKDGDIYDLTEGENND